MKTDHQDNITQSIPVPGASSATTGIVLRPMASEPGIVAAQNRSAARKVARRAQIFSGGRVYLLKMQVNR
jgi:hypothetical protein